MKMMIVMMLAVFSLGAFAAQMNEDAAEMFDVLTHHQVVKCLGHVPKMVNVTIEKEVYRCPGCNTYTISGHELGIDTPNPEKTHYKIIGSAERGDFGYQQSYTCEKL